MILAAVLVLFLSHQHGPADRPPVTLDCAEIPAMIRRLELIRVLGEHDPSVRIKVERLIVWLRGYAGHECRTL